MLWGWILLVPFAALCFVQNAAYTWSSKTRAGDDPGAHRRASWASNGIYYVGQLVQTIYTVKYLQDSPWLLVASCVVYLWATSEGSVHMMKRFMEKREEAIEQLAESTPDPEPLIGGIKDGEAVIPLPADYS